MKADESAESGIVRCRAGKLGRPFLGKSKLNDNHYGYDVGYAGKAIPQIADSIKLTDVAD